MVNLGGGRLAARVQVPPPSQPGCVWVQVSPPHSQGVCGCRCVGAGVSPSWPGCVRVQVSPPHSQCVCGCRCLPLMARVCVGAGVTPSQPGCVWVQVSPPHGQGVCGAGVMARKCEAPPSPFPSTPTSAAGSSPSKGSAEQVDSWRAGAEQHVAQEVRSMWHNRSGPCGTRGQVRVAQEVRSM